MLGAGKEKLQGPSDFLHGARQEGLKYASSVIVRQVTAALATLGLFKREAVLAHDQLGQLGAAKSLVALVQQLLALQHLQAGGTAADFNQRDDGRRRRRRRHRQISDQARCGTAQGIGLHIQHGQLEPGGLG